MSGRHISLLLCVPGKKSFPVRISAVHAVLSVHCIQAGVVLSRNVGPHINAKTVLKCRRTADEDKSRVIPQALIVAVTCTILHIYFNQAFYCVQIAAAQKNNSSFSRSAALFHALLGEEKQSLRRRRQPSLNACLLFSFSSISCTDVTSVYRMESDSENSPSPLHRMCAIRRYSLLMSLNSAFKASFVKIYPISPHPFMISKNQPKTVKRKYP